MNLPDCVFCRIVSGHIPSAKVYEDDVVLAFLDIGPIAAGHTLVIPKKHFATIDNCDSDTLGRLWVVMPKIAHAVKDAMHVSGYNILCNTGKVAGQVVEHVHFHVIPRVAGDGLLSGWPVSKYHEGEIEKIAAQVRQKIAGIS